MCGIAGALFDPSARPWASSAETTRRMTDCIAYRGPDGPGGWYDDDAGVMLGHLRLSVIDLSSEGNQPMVSASGRYVVSYNGEIYNYRTIRDRLGARAWRGHSDTEVMLAAFESWGIPQTLAELNGMFAMAVWDRQNRRLVLARDRAGEKPLYYGVLRDGTVAFASELKAIRALPAAPQELDSAALAAYLRYGYVPAPRSIYRGINKLPPATWLQIPWSGAGVFGATLASPVTYWSADEDARRALDNPFAGGDGEAIDTLDAVLRQAVDRRTISDVPIGAFLSGGIDSSTIVALMQSVSTLPVKTFTIGFDDAAYDEANGARAVAEHLGTEHTEMRVTAREALDVVPLLPSMYDEPFADSSQIPTFLVARLARARVTVSLSGDGGDELFGGYNRHLWGPRIWNRSRLLPRPARRVVGRALRALSVEHWNAVSGPLMALLPAGRRVQRPGQQLRKLGGVLAAGREAELYEQLVSVGSPSIQYGQAPPHGLAETRMAMMGDFARSMMHTDFITYLPDDILAKLDRATMAVSLEGRVPFLDPDVIDFAWRLPHRFKIRDGEGKWIVRRVLERYVPRRLTDRPKMGFGIPVGAWLRGPLRDWAAALLDPSVVRSRTDLDPVAVDTIWRRHLRGEEGLEHQLWILLMFQAWRTSTT